MVPIASGSGPGAMVSDALVTVAPPIAAPAVAIIPATPQGSQGAIPTPASAASAAPTPVVTEDALPPPPPAVVRSWSRTPASALLGVESRTTRSRSRSKTPIS